MKEIQLSGSDLDEMQTLTRRVQTDLLKVADRVLTVLHGDAHGVRIRSLHFIPNNSKTGIYNEQLVLIGVWEDPPGVCRGPGAGETID